MVLLKYNVLAALHQYITYGVSNELCQCYTSVCLSLHRMYAFVLRVCVCVCVRACVCTYIIYACLGIMDIHIHAHVNVTDTHSRPTHTSTIYIYTQVTWPAIDLYLFTKLIISANHALYKCLSDELVPFYSEIRVIPGSVTTGSDCIPRYKYCQQPCATYVLT